MDGTKRENIKPGARVSIVLKKDQPTGKLTDGVIKDILTKSPTHPHGIKVRLQTGDVGRVKQIHEQVSIGFKLPYKKTMVIGEHGVVSMATDTTRLDKILEDGLKDKAQREKGYRERALKLFPWICSRCGREFSGKRLKELTVHHKDHNHDNNPPDGSNWELLCIYCHDNEHQRDEVALAYAEEAPGRKPEATTTFKPFANLGDLLKGKKQPLMGGRRCPMKSHAESLDDRGQRIQNALWGLFIGDALSMPAHWFYSLDHLNESFNGGIRGYVDPPHPHPESFMVGMDYNPDVETANRLGRNFDILHEHARFYKTNYGTLRIESTDRETEHGHLVPKPKERYHYHHGLVAGENTLGAHLVRVLMRSVIQKERYDPEAFLEGFVGHLTRPGLNRDPYTEIYIRRWFENYSRGLPPHACAELQRNVWSISAHGGMIRPMVLSLLLPSGYQALGAGVEHQNLTHRSETVVSALGVAISLIQDLIQGKNPRQTVLHHAAAIRIPRVTGVELFSAYRDHHGPGNIPKEEMWRLHTRLRDHPFDLERLAREQEEKDVVLNLLATACYPEHGLPLLLYLALKHDFGFKSALLANTNAGGDNVHRGMVLGLILGAVNRELPDHLLKGLIAFHELKAEIEAYTTIALRKDAF